MSIRLVVWSGGCPEGTTGTPPDCIPIDDTGGCPEGTTGTPPDCIPIDDIGPPEDEEDQETGVPEEGEEFGGTDNGVDEGGDEGDAGGGDEGDAGGGDEGGDEGGEGGN